MYHKSNINILRRVDLEHEHVESMRFELQTKVHPILVNINYRSELRISVFSIRYIKTTDSNIFIGYLII
jgi:hypothetical protein